MEICNDKTDLMPCELFCPHTKVEDGLLVLVSCPYAGNEEALHAVGRKGWCAFNPQKAEVEAGHKSMGWKRGRSK
jgi:hypothetical protein